MNTYHRPFPVFTTAVAAHLATAGYELRLAPSRRRPTQVIWLAPGEARPLADKFILTLRLLDEERKAYTPTQESPHHGSADQ